MGCRLDLLVVDDEPSQFVLMRALLSELQLSHGCHYVPSGRLAFDFLHRRYPFEHAPRPHLILLDLNMPGMSGCEVLQQIKSSPEFRTIPVIMLSTSRALTDVDACYRERANAYIRKPPDLESSLNFVRSLDRFWAELVLMP